VRSAIAISMASFIATGLAAAVLYVRGRGVPRVRSWDVVLATAPGALAGALVLAYVPPRVPLTLLALLLVATALRILRQPAAPAPRTAPATRAVQWAVGAVAGFASALTGTGGPLVLVPVQLWRGEPLLVAVATGQVAQLPIALVATAGNALASGVDVRQSALIGALLLPGVWLGPRLARATPQRAFTQGVAVLLLAAGAWLLLRALAR